MLLCLPLALDSEFLRAEIMSQLSLYFKPFTHFLVCYAELNKMEYLIYKVIESEVKKTMVCITHRQEPRIPPKTIHTHQAHKI